MRDFSRQRASSSGKFAYVFGAFPYFSQTFNMEEIRCLIERGLDVVVFSMKRPAGYQSAISHSSFRAYQEKIIYVPPPWSLAALKSQVRYLFAKPVLTAQVYLSVILGHGRKLGTLVKTLAFMPAAFHCARMMDERGVTHVHAGMSRYAATFALVTSKLTGLPFSFTMHGPKSFARGAMQAAKIRHAKFVTTISRYNRNLLAQFTDEEGMAKVHVIHVGIDPGKFAFRGSPGAENPRSGRGEWRVLSVARMDRDKGLDYLVRAVSSLKDRIPGISLTLVGEGPEKAALEALAASLDIARIVRFTGPLEHEEVIREYREARAFVLPSFWEGIPVVLMEAMAVGVPVVATNITGIPELVTSGENGFLVPTADSDAIARALLSLYEDAELAGLFALRGREKVEREFSIGARAEQLDVLFNETSRAAAPARGEAYA
jgi:glycosyltransferase involved in cell wall biosynthesis